MTGAKDSFKRGEGPGALSNTSHASTDALKALQKWVGKGNRSYEVELDEDDELVAVLTFEQEDISAGPQLDDACEEHGVKRTFVEVNEE